MKRQSLSVLRKRVQKAIDTLTVGQLDPDRYCEFAYLASRDETPIEITREDFFQDEPPPGLYRFRITDGAGELLEQGEGELVEFKRDREEEERPNGSIGRLVSSLCNTSAAEVERLKRRLAEEEERADKAKELVRQLEARLRELEKENADLCAELAAAGDGELNELGELLGQIAMRVLGLEDQDPACAEAFEVVIAAVRKSADAQAAIQQICGEAPLRRLGIGGGT